MDLGFLIKVNTNYYAADSIEVVEVVFQSQPIESAVAFYKVNIHTKSGKTFLAFQGKTLEEALDHRSDIINILTKIEG